MSTSPRHRRIIPVLFATLLMHIAIPAAPEDFAASSAEFFRSPVDLFRARHLFERETFGGNGRTCLTCHSRDTGTLSPEDAQRRFAHNRKDPLFLADGSDDGQGAGSQRIRKDATILVRIPL